MLAFFDTLVQHELESWSTVDNRSSSSTSTDDTSTERSEATSVTEEPSEEEPEQDQNQNQEQAENDEEGESSHQEQDLDTPNVSELSWQTHPNRIFYLIAKKRRALLQLAVRGTTGQPRNVEQLDQLLQKLLGEQKQAATQARITDWLDETHRLFGDDELPTTSAEAAARELTRRNGTQSNPEPKTVETLQSNLEQRERKRRLQLRRVTTIKKRRTARRLTSDLENDSAVSNEADWLDSDEEESLAGDQLDTNHLNNATESGGTLGEEDEENSSSTASMTSMEAQLSRAPSTSSSHPLSGETELNNNNSQLASNRNHKTVNGLTPDICNTESTASTSSSM